MSKLTLNDVGSGYNLPQVVNANSQATEAALENTLSRDGTSPNQMQASLDMNSKSIINLGSPVNATDAARLADITGLVNVTGIVAPSQVGNSGKSLTTNGTSAAWTFVSSYTAITSAESAAAVTISDFFKAPGDIRRYGAACDGTTDDTAAINAGASAVRSALVGIRGAPNVLLFPMGGTCKVSSTLDFSGITVDGGGFNLSGVPHIKATTAQFNVIKSSGRTTIRNLFVDGGWDQTTAGMAGDAMSFIDPIAGHAYDIYLDNVAIVKAKKRGIYWEGGAYGYIYRPQISSCGLHAVELFSVDPAHTTTTIGIVGKGSMSSTPNGYALKITACVSISIDTMIMEGTRGVLVAGSGNRTLSFNDVYQESPIGTTFLDLGSSDGTGLSVTNCFGTVHHITEPANWSNVNYSSNSLLAESSIPPSGRYVISDSGELTTAVTGGTNFTAGTLALPPGTWLINSTMQVQDAGGSTIVKAGIKITGSVGDSGLNINTNVNFTEGCDECNAFGASKDGRLHAWQLYQNSTGATVNIFLRGFINISAGTIAYRGYSTAVKMQ